MAAVRPSRPIQSSLRTPADPFNDPTSPRRPPPVPPKTKTRSPTAKSQPKSSHMPAPVAKAQAAPRDAQPDIVEAVRDTVVVRKSTDGNSRPRAGRSQTIHSQTSPSTAHSSARRSHSQDSSHDKSKNSTGAKGRKKGSQHADVIDRLDFTSVGPMLHHDGPFDACAPSRNRQRNKAPMFAWSARHDEAVNPHDAKAFSNTRYVDPPKKKVDAIAEAWGIHEPEPYEEFFAGGGAARTPGDTPASSIYNGRESHNSKSTARQTREDNQSSATRAARGPTRRPLVPPPQPIFVPDAGDVTDPGQASPPLSAPGYPKRTKSLMQRIRKMRDAPNVPVGPDFDPPSSPGSPVDHSYPGARPKHRSQNSFIGRLGGGGKSNGNTETSEPFVYIEANTKQLPTTPPSSTENDGQLGGTPGLARKTSLMKKMGRVVGRGRQ